MHGNYAMSTIARAGDFGVMVYGSGVHGYFATLMEAHRYQARQWSMSVIFTYGDSSNFWRY